MYYVSSTNTSQHTQPTDGFQQKAARAAAFLYEASVEPVAFAVAGAVVHLFLPSLTAPLLGISLGLFAAKLVIKLLDSYNPLLLIKASKKVCDLKKQIPQFQMISLIFVLIMGMFSRSLGFILGTGHGIYSAVVLNIENYKLIQEANRRKMMRG